MSDEYGTAHNPDHDPEFHWPREGRFRFHDDPGPHDPCYVVLPCGSTIALNHYNDATTDIKRAKFIIDACNKAWEEYLEREKTFGHLVHPVPPAVMDTSFKDFSQDIANKIGKTFGMRHARSSEINSVSEVFSPEALKDIANLSVGVPVIVDNKKSETVNSSSPLHEKLRQPKQMFADAADYWRTPGKKKSYFPATVKFNQEKWDQFPANLSGYLDWAIYWRLTAGQNHQEWADDVYIDLSGYLEQNNGVDLETKKKTVEYVAGLSNWHTTWKGDAIWIYPRHLDKDGKPRHFHGALYAGVLDE